MKKIILIPDSFKGTMSSIQVCGILRDKVLEHFPRCSVVSIPVADGGEGTVDCFLAAVGGKRISTVVSNPFFERIESFYAVLPDEKTAVIEVAAAIGLPLVEDRKNPVTASSYGVGELIRHAVENSCTNIILGLGGSSTNDAGAGMAAALGVKFSGNSVGTGEPSLCPSLGTAFIPTGGTLDRICGIDTGEAEKLLSGCTITAMCDVKNPLFGSNGAAYVFGPQKGATPEMVELLDRNLRHAAAIIKEKLDIDVSSLQGGGAAGGIGAGVSAFLGGRLASGIDTVLDTVRFDELIRGADLVITGEGRLDSQSLQGKVVSGVAVRAVRQRIPVIVIAGDIEDGAEAVYDLGVTSLISINKRPEPFEKSRCKSFENLAFTADSLMRILKTGKSLSLK